SLPLPPRSPLFPYTTLFRSERTPMIKHHHFIGRFEVTSPPLEGDQGYLKSWMFDLIEAQGMKVLSGPHVAFVANPGNRGLTGVRSEEHTSELQSRENLVCRL